MTQQEAIRIFMSVLNTHGYSQISYNDETENHTVSRQMLDEAIRTCSGYDGIEDAISKFIDACTNATGETVTEKLLQVCGIDMSNDDTGAITGLDAGGSAVAKTSESVVQEKANKYTASTSTAQNITTGTKGWIVNATAADDTIDSGGDDSINAGAGADTIILNGKSAVVYGGAGADNITVNSTVKNIVLGDLSAEDTLTISNAITVAAANFVDGVGLIIKTTDDRIFNFIGITAENVGNFSVVNGNSTVTLASLIEGKPADSNLVVTYSGDNSATSNTENSTEINGTVNVNLDAVATVSGTFYADNNGGNATFNDSSAGVAVGEVSSDFDVNMLQKVSYSDGDYLSFTVKGLTVRLIGKRNDDKVVTSQITATNFNELETYLQVITAALYKWWIKESINLNDESYGISFETEGVAVTQMDVYLESSSTSGTLAYVATSDIDSEGKTRHLDLVINDYHYDNITSATDENGISNGQGYLDRTLAHEFTHAIMSANIDWFSNLPMFIKEGAAELTHGIDDFRAGTIQTLMGDIDKLQKYLKLSVTNSSQVDDDEGQYPYAAGYMFLRWLAKTAAETGNIPLANLLANVTLNTSSSGTFYINRAEGSQTATTTAADVSVGAAENLTYTLNDAVKQNISFDGAWKIQNLASNDTVTVADENSTANASIYGAGHDIFVKTGAGADYINVTGKYNSINAGNGNNTIDGGGMDNSYSKVTAGSGDDSIAYFGNYVSMESGAGNDTVEFDTIHDHNYIDTGAGQDYVKVYSTNHTINAGADDDEIYLYNMTINYVDENNNPTTVITYTPDYNEVDAGDGADKITNSGNYNKINAGAGADIIYNYNMYNTLAGGAGADQFWMLEGSDYITLPDFDVSEDSLLLYDSEIDSVVYYSENEELIFGDTLHIYFDNPYLDNPLYSSIEEFYGMQLYIRNAEDNQYYSKSFSDLLPPQFDWSEATENPHYFLIGDADVEASNTIEIADGNYYYLESKLKTGKMYVKLILDDDDNLSLSVVNGDGTDATNYFKGTVQFSAKHSISFEKDSTAAYTVEFDGVNFDSTFKNLGANDKVSTFVFNAANGSYQSISINNKIYTYDITKGSVVYGGNDNQSYAYAGDFLVTENVVLSDGTSVSYSAEESSENKDGVIISVSEGALTALTDFEVGESVTINDFTYTRTDDTITRRDAENNISYYKGEIADFLTNLNNAASWTQIYENLWHYDSAENLLEFYATAEVEFEKDASDNITSFEITSRDPPNFTIKNLDNIAATMTILGAYATEITGITVDGESNVTISETLIPNDANLEIGGENYQFNLGKAANVTLKSKNTKIVGAQTGANVFYVDNSITQLADGEFINFTGGAGTNEFNISGISVTGNGRIELVGNATAVDTFTIANSNNITITAGANAGDILNFSGNVTATVTDFNADDILKFVNEVKLTSFANGVLIFTEKQSGNIITLNVGDADTNLSTHGQMIVHNGSNDTEGRKLITMANSWTHTENTTYWEYGPGEGDKLFTVTGFNSGVVIDNNGSITGVEVSTDNSTVIISDATVFGNLLGTGVTLTNNTSADDGVFKFWLGENAKSQSFDTATWDTTKSSEGAATLYGGTDTVSYYFSSTEGDSVIAVSVDNSQADVILAGLKNNYTADGLTAASTGSSVTVASAAIGTGVITISTAENYLVTFDSSTSVLLADNNATVIGSNYADTFAIAEALNTQTGSIYIDGGGAADIFNISNITVKSGDGVTLNGGEGDDVFTLSGAEGFYVDADDGNDIVNIVGGDKNTIISGSTGSDTVVFSGDNGAGIYLSGLDTNDAFSLSADVTAGTLSGAVMTLTSGGHDYTITLGAAPDATLYDNVNVYVGNTTSILGDIIDAKQWVTVDGGVEYGRVSSGGIFTITGGNFAETVGNGVAKFEGATVGGEYVTVGSAGLIGTGLTITGNDYTFALADNATSGSFEAQWDTTSANTAAFIAAGTATYATAESAKQIAVTAPEASFKLLGVATDVLGNFAVPAADGAITIVSGASASDAVTISVNDTYAVAFDGAQNVAIGALATDKAITGSDGNDTITFGAFELAGAATVDAGSGTDLITVSDITITMDGALNVYGGAGADTINVTGMSGALTVVGGANADVFTLTNSTINVDASDGADIINITGGASTITSGDGDSDTISFGASATGVYIGGLDSTDALAFGEGEISGSISSDNTLMTITSNSNDFTITLGKALTAADYDTMSVYVGGTESILGEIIDPHQWVTVASDAVQYGRKSSGGIFTITGGNFAETVGEDGVASFEGATVGGEYVTVGAAGLLGDGATLNNKTDGTYKFALSGDATIATDAAEWATLTPVSGLTTISLYDAGTTVTYSVKDADATVISSSYLDDASLVLQGVTVSGITETNLATPSADTFNVAAGLIDSGTQITIATNEHYNLTFGAAAQFVIGDVASGTAITGSNQADTISFALGAAVTVPSTVNGGNEADLFNISNVTVGTGGALDIVAGEGKDTINLTEAVGLNIDASNDADFISIVGGGVNTITSSTSDTFVFDASKDAAVYISNFDGTDQISLGGAEVTGTLNAAGTSFTLTSGEHNYTINLADTITSTVYDAVTVSAGANTSILGDIIDAYQWETVASDAVEYGRAYSGGIFTITGGTFAETVGNGVAEFEGATVGGEYVTVGSAGLIGDGVTLTNAEGGTPYKFAVAEGVASTLTVAEWDAAEAAAGVSTISLFDKDTEVTYAVKDTTVIEPGYNGDAVLVLEGVASAGAAALTTLDGSAFTVSSDLIGDTAITISENTGYDLTFGAAANVEIGALADTKAVTGSDGNDTITFGAFELAGAATVDAGSGTDLITVSDITFAMDGALNVYGGADADTIDVTGMSGALTVAGGEGADVFTLTNSTINVDASDGADIINITGGANTITSGDKDSDTFVFDASAGVYISSLDSTDAISLGADVTAGTVSAGDAGFILTAGGTEITVNTNATDIKDLYDVQVYQGTKEGVALGDLIDPYIWSTVEGGVQYGRREETEGDFSIIGGGFTVDQDTVAAIQVDGSTVTITDATSFEVPTLSAAVFGGDVATLTAKEGTSFAFAELEDTASDTTEVDLWDIGSTTATLYATGAQVNYTAEDTIISAAFDADAEAGLVLEGLKSDGVTAENFTAPVSGAVTVGSALIGDTAITISANTGYDVTFEDGAAIAIGELAAGKKVVGSADADTITFGTFEIAGAATVDAGDGANDITVSNVTFGSSGALYVAGGEDADTITVSDLKATGAGKLSVAGGEEADLFNVSNSTGVSIVSGEDDADTFALSSGAGVYISGFDSTDAISLTDAVEAGEFKNGNIIFEGQASINIGDAEITDLYQVNVTHGDSTDILGDLIDPYGFYATDTLGTFEYRRGSAATDKLFTISGLNTVVTAEDGEIDGITVANGYATVTKANVLTQSDVVLTNEENQEYKLAVEGELKIAPVENWVVKDTVASYITSDITFVVEDGVDTVITASLPAGDIVFEGVVSNAPTSAFDYDADNVKASVGSAAIGSTQITVATSAENEIYFESAANVMVADANTSIFGSSGADTLEVSNVVTEKEGNVIVDGGAGADVLKVTGVTAGDEQAINLIGGAADDTFEITDSENINIDASDGADVINIAGSTGISILSGSDDSDNLNFGAFDEDAVVTVNGLDTTDKISLSAEITKGGIDEEDASTIVLTTEDAEIKIVAAGVTTLSTIYDIDVTDNVDGTARSRKLGDIIDPYIWQTVTGGEGIVWARGNDTTDALFTVTGLKIESDKFDDGGVAEIEGLTVSTNGVSITSAELLNSQDIVLTNADGQSYKLYIDTKTKETLTENIVANVGDSPTITASYIPEETTFTYAGTGSTILSPNFPTGAVVISNLNTVIPYSSSDNAITVTADAINSTVEIGVAINNSIAPDVEFGSAAKFKVDTFAVTGDGEANKVTGSSDADTITVTGNVAKDSNAEINGGAGNDSIVITDLTVASPNNAVTGISIKGGAGDDTINVNALAGNSAGRNYILIDGDDVDGSADAGKDVIFVTGSSHISIVSGESDSDTLVLSGTNAISVGGLDATDAISLASATSDASISTDETNGTLKLGTNTIYLEGVASADDMVALYDMTVYNGTDTVALGDLVDPKKWTKDTDADNVITYTFGRQNTDTGVISLGSGLNANVTAAQLDSVTANGIVTIQSSMLGTSNVAFTVEDGYSVTLASGAQNSLAAAWVNLDGDDTTTYAYKLAGNTTYSISEEDGEGEIIATDARETAVQLKGLAAAPTGAPANNAAVIDADAITSGTEIDIESGTGYAFTFQSNANTNAYVSVGAGLSTVAVSGGAGADSLVAGEGTSYVSLFGGTGADTLVTEENGNTLAGGAGADVFILGEDVASLTISDADSLDAIILNTEDDLESGSITDGVLTIGKKIITLSNVTGDNASAMYGLKVYKDGDDTEGVLIQDLVDVIGWNMTGTTATYGRKYGNEAGLITVSNLNSIGAGEDIDDYITLTADAVNTTLNYVEITDAGLLDSLKTAALTYSSSNTSYTAANTQITVASGITEYSYIDAQWAYDKSASILSYTTYDEQPGYEIADDGQSISYNVNQHDESSFSVSGLNITWADTMSATGVEGITLTTITADTGTLTFESTTYFGTADISIKGTEQYELTLSLQGAENYVQGTPERTWKAESSNAVYYNNTVAAGYNYVAEDNIIYYQSLTGGDGIVTLTGMGAVADSLISASVVSGANITLNKELLASVTADTIELKKADANSAYKLVLDPDAKYTTSNANWSVPSNSGTAIYTQAATTAGWNADDSLTISKINAAGGDVVTITGLATSTALRSGKINGLTYDEDTTTFTFGAKVLAEQSVSISSAQSETYIVSLAADVATVGAREGAFWTSENSIASYYNETAATKVKTAGYTATSTGITYSEEDVSGATPTYVIEGLSAKATVKNDKISGFTVNDSSNTLKIAANLIGANGATITAAPTDATITLGGKAKLASSVSNAITLVGSSGNDSLSNIGSGKVTIDGMGGNDYIITGKNGDYVTGGKGNDTVSLGGGADTLEYQGGKDVVLGYTDKASIYTGDVKSWSYANNNLTLNIGSGSLTFNGVSSIKAGDYIYRENFLYDAASKTNVTIGASAPSALTYADYGVGTGTASIVNASNLKNAISITAGSSASSILGTAKDDFLTGGTGADTLNGGKGNDTLRTGGGADSLYGDAGKDLFIIDSVQSGQTVTIADYAAKQDAISIGGGASIANAYDDGTDITLALSNNGSIKVVGGSGKAISISGSGNVIFGSGSFMNDKKTAVTLVSGSTYDAPSTMVTINGAGNSTAMSITGSAKANSILGGSGNDFINGGKGNDTLYGGAGKDVFAYTTGEGKDVFADFVAADDSISLSGGVAALTKSSLSSDGKTLTLTVNKQDVVIKSDSSLKDTAISINGAGYKFDNNMMFNSGSTAVSLFSAFKGTDNKGAFDATSYTNLVSIDGAANSVSSAMNVTGNGQANVISGGKAADSLNGGDGADTISGGKGNDYITGGAGDDSLAGGDGKDTFIYNSGDGKDKIADYKAGQDKLQIAADLASIKVSQSGSSVIVDVGATTGAITLENWSTNNTAGNNAKLSIVDVDGKTTTKTITKWVADTSSDVFDLFEDDNFISDVPEINDVSAITDNKYAVGNVKSDNLNSLTQTQDFVTYGEDDKK